MFIFLSAACQPNNQKETPLHRAALAGNTLLVKRLLEWVHFVPMDPNATNKYSPFSSPPLSFHLSPPPGEATPPSTSRSPRETKNLFSSSLLTSLSTSLPPTPPDLPMNSVLLLTNRTCLLFYQQVCREEEERGREGRGG